MFIYTNIAWLNKDPGTECPKIHRNSVLHLLKNRFAVNFAVGFLLNICLNLRISNRDRTYDISITHIKYTYFFIMKYKTVYIIYVFNRTEMYYK